MRLKGPRAQAQKEREPRMAASRSMAAHMMACLLATEHAPDSEGKSTEMELVEARRMEARQVLAVTVMVPSDSLESALQMWKV